MKLLFKYLPRSFSMDRLSDLLRDRDALQRVVANIQVREEELNRLKREARKAADDAANFEVAHRGASEEEIADALSSLKATLSQEEATVIINTVAEVFDVKSSDILATTRHRRDIVIARQTCMLIMMEDLGQTASHVGALMGRDHSTVFYNVSRARVSLDSRVMEARELMK